MKPLDQPTHVDQALSNGKGVTWLDDCRVPYQSEDEDTRRNSKGGNNGMLNLITSCFDCNRGKGNKKLKKEG